MFLQKVAYEQMENKDGNSVNETFIVMRYVIRAVQRMYILYKMVCNAITGNVMRVQFILFL